MSYYILNESQGI